MFSIYICVLFKSRKILWKFIVFSFIVISPLLFHYSLFPDLQSLFPNGFDFSQPIFAEVTSIKCEYLYLFTENSIGLTSAKVVTVFSQLIFANVYSIKCEYLYLSVVNSIGTAFAKVIPAFPSLSLRKFTLHKR